MTTLSTMGTCAPDVRFTVAGCTLQVLSDAASVQVSATAPANVPSESATSWKVAGMPAVTVWLATPTGARQKSVAVPDNAMFCGLVGELSVIGRVAVFAPAAEPHGAATGEAGGVNVTVRVQWPPAGTPAAQLLAAVNLPVGFTMAATTVRIAGGVPQFVMVTATGADAVPARALPKPIVTGEIVAAACTAVPPTATICGLCGAVSEISTTAERSPVCVGSKVTLTTQAFPPASGLREQLSVSAKSPGLLPAMLMVIATGVVPVLLTLTT
jgi:hypothetical protein